MSADDEAEVVIEARNGPSRSYLLDLDARRLLAPRPRSALENLIAQAREVDSSYQPGPALYRLLGRAEHLFGEGLVPVFEDAGRLRALFELLDFELVAAFVEARDLSRKGLMETLSDPQETELRRRFSEDVVEPSLTTVIAARERLTTPPFHIAADTSSRNPLAHFQGHHAPSPEGVHSMAGWQFEGGRGNGRRLADVEQGWSLGHEDLLGLETELIWGTNLAFQAHGANTLGVIAARDNDRGGLGLVPSIGIAYLSSENDGSPYADTANAILAALQRLEAGDVLLIESQRASGSSLVPAEFDDVVFELIGLATALGIVTVEPAGNGGQLLDEIRSPTATAAVFDRAVRDSGAIMVAAASSTVPHFPMSFTNFGSRVDCYAWGEGVVTTGGDASNSLPGAYNFSYGGTSSAAAIIAGVALQLQGIAALSSRGFLSPADLRAIVSDPALGTSSQSGGKDGIGVMPDLEKIFTDGRVLERLEPRPRS